MRFITVLIMSLGLGFSSLTSAASSLVSHGLAVSKSMSAFYMYGLTQGDSRYLGEFENFARQAEASLKEYSVENAVTANSLSAEWQALRPTLKHEYVKDAGYIVPVEANNRFRAYLTHVYELVLKEPRQELKLNQQLARVDFDIEVICARFFDVSNHLYGALSISNTDLAIDPPKIAAQINAQLAMLRASKSTPPAVLKNLEAVQGKWKFIEDTVVNYKDEAAYFLVYYNMGHIGKMLSRA